MSRETLYRISFFDVLFTMLTSGFWMLGVYWFNGVEAEVPDEAA